jgi:GcrA cell cycle regulator
MHLPSGHGMPPVRPRRRVLRRFQNGRASRLAFDGARRSHETTPEGVFEELCPVQCPVPVTGPTPAVHFERDPIRGLPDHVQNGGGGMTKVFEELKATDCRWPMADGFFCADAASPGRPYCMAHTALARRPNTNAVRQPPPRITRAIGHAIPPVAPMPHRLFIIVAREMLSKF